jgi:hypothetical protein
MQSAVRNQGEVSPHEAPLLVIPDEDPQRPIDLGEDQDCEDILEASGEGLGSEDVGEEEGDEVDDECDPEEEAAVGEKKSRKCYLPPTWLCKAFKARLSEVAPNVRNGEGLPPLYYCDRTFWFPQPSSFFLLRCGDVNPQRLFNPQFFLWDPLPLCNGIPCPNCQTTLERHTNISFPRCCVDSSSTFWIIGYRYHCRHCLHPKSKKNTVTFRSWDSRILRMLPRALADEFPAHLSHRSGMSKCLFSFMRSCFQNGMGPKQFADALCVQHLLKYDELQLQYLHSLTACKLDHWTGRKYYPFLPFDDSSYNGFHGFIPSSQWLRDMYDKFIEDHRQHFNQHTAMLSAEICALDHSHKVFVVSLSSTE